MTFGDGEPHGEIKKVGFIGLGDMGGAMVDRIVAEGFETTLWARRPEVLDSMVGPTVHSAGSPAELAASVDLVGICVWADQDVRAVMEGVDGVLSGCRPGTVVAIHSTIQPATCLELAAAGAELGVSVVDAPVSGGRIGALAGTLVVAVGGDGPVVERCRRVFAAFGNPVIHVGPVGSAQLGKLVNNAVLAANIAVADDALTLASSAGIQPEAMAELLRHGSGRSYALDVALSSRSSAEMRHNVLTPLDKDVTCLTEDAAPEACVSVPLLVEAAAEALRRLVDPPSSWEV